MPSSGSPRPRPAPLAPPPLPELEPAPELDAPPEVEPLLEPDEPIELEEFPELDPLPELETLPEWEAPPSPCGALPAVELLPHAPAITTRHTRHPVIAERNRTPGVAVSMLTPSCSGSGSHRRNPSCKRGYARAIQRR